MPELPEVETIRRDLSRVILNKTIKKVEVLDKKPAKPNVETFISVLTGNQLIGLERHGKLLIFRLKEGEKFLLIHLKLTGQLIYRLKSRTIYGGHDVPKTAENLPNKFTRIIFHFGDNSVLYFNDLRKFGWLKIAVPEEKEKIEKETLGVDALSEDFTLKKFQDILLKKRTRPIKAVLMDQALIAGLGNIYSDEACFLSKIKPNRRAGSLSAAEIKSLYGNIKKVLHHALQHRGTTFGIYIDSHGRRGGFADFLKVYQREGEKCLRCKKGIIEKWKMGGRTSRYCPICQK